MKNNYILDFSAFVVFAILSIALAVLAYSFGGVDFNVYYAAARVTLAGGNPYDFQQLTPQIISSAGEINNPYYYAPWFTWLVIPFALFPYSVARILWACFNFILWLWALFNLSKLIDYPQTGWKKWGVWLLATFVFAWSTWGSEQVGILILFLFTLILLFVQRENWIAVGICLALILFKPNITAIPAGAISIWLIIHRKQWIPFFVMIGTTMLMVVASLFITPNWYLAVLQPDKLQGLSYTLNAYGETEIQRYTTTLPDWLSLYGLENSASVTIYALTSIFGILSIIYAVMYFKSLKRFSALVILLNFTIIPYALFYDYPLLTFTLFSVNEKFIQNRLTWLQRFMNALVFTSLFLGEDIRYRYWMIILFILFSIGAWYFSTERKSGNLISSAE